MPLKCDDYSRRPSLSALAALGRPLVGVEVGVLNGDHSARMLAALPIDRLWLVDMWKPYVQLDYHWDFTPCYLEVVERFKDDPRVGVIKEASPEAAARFADGSLNFVYLDACHEEESVARDIDGWLPKIRENGILCGHDFESNWMGVVRAVMAAQRKYDWDLQTRTPDWWVIIEGQ
jgi:hypothetical protein